MDHLAQLSLKSEVKFYNTRFRATMNKLEAVRKGTKSRGPIQYAIIIHLIF